MPTRLPYWNFSNFWLLNRSRRFIGPGLAAEFSAIIESEFAGDSLGDRTPLQNILRTHASIFRGAVLL